MPLVILFSMNPFFERVSVQPLYLLYIWFVMMNIGRILAFSLLAMLALVACDSEKVEFKDASAADEKSQDSVKVETSILKIKVRKVLGETDYLKRNVETWKPLRYGQNVMERDRIRTAVESEAVLGALDGSSIWIKEKSDVVIDANLLNSVNEQISVTVTNGFLYFDIQKQPPVRQLYLKTGVMATAIRGTSGFIGSVNGQSITSLKEGKVDVTNAKGKVQTILANQTILVNEKGFSKKLKLKSSGTEALANALDSIVNAPAKKKKAPSLESSLKKFDTKYAKRLAKFEKRLRFWADPLPDTLFDSKVTLMARLTPGVIVSVLGESDSVGADSVYKHTFEWGKDAYGQKRFLASCREGDVEIPCYMWTTIYAPLPKAAGAADSALTASGDSASALAASNDSALAAEGSSNEGAAVGSVSVKINGPKTERVHWFYNKGNYSANLKFSLEGVGAAGLGQVKSVSVKRKGKVVREFKKNELTSLAYSVPVSVASNKIAKFQVEVLMENGKKYTASKTYEVYCNPRNHPGGKERNSLKKPDEEYADVKSRGMLKNE